MCFILIAFEISCFFKKETSLSSSFETKPQNFKHAFCRRLPFNRLARKPKPVLRSPLKRRWYKFHSRFFLEISNTISINLPLFSCPVFIPQNNSKNQPAVKTSLKKQAFYTAVYTATCLKTERARKKHRRLNDTKMISGLIELNFNIKLMSHSRKTPERP